MKLRSVPAGIAALAVALAVGFTWELRETPGTRPATVETGQDEYVVSADELPRGDRLDAQPRALQKGDRLDAQQRAHERGAFATRFANAFGATKTDPHADAQVANNTPPPDVSSQAPAREAEQRTTPERVAAADAPPARAEDAPTRSIAPPEKSDNSDKSDKSEKHTHVASLESPSAPLGDTDEHTAIYDISAHTVYLPDGAKLEAHSGLGSHKDDPHSVSLRNRGATPPNVYRLSLREHLFHGVRALRLIPVGDGNMFGRDGILAHSYMLGSTGQSNGCVSVRNYPAFLQAFLSGKVERLKVVRHLPTSDPRIASLR